MFLGRLHSNPSSEGRPPGGWTPCCAARPATAKKTAGWWFGNPHKPPFVDNEIGVNEINGFD